jgi:hypothetical protein
LPSASWKP